MSDKPSLYVVEKKEVIILVVLFVLVTVLSFTLGVRYGESVGRKAAHEQEMAAREQGGEGTEAGGGTLGKSGSHSDEAGSLDTSGEGAKEAGKGDAKPESKAVSKDGAEAKGETKAEAKGDAKPAPADGATPEDAAHHAATTAGTHEAVDKNSDEYLLNALKDAGVEPPGGKAPDGAKLPDSMKEAPATPKTATKAKSGTFVIQVGSHPTESEAESQLRGLVARRVSAEILPAFRDRQGEWHRVVIGGFKSKREAEKEASGLKSKGSIASYFVWRLP